MSVRDVDFALRLCKPCPLCEEQWQQGDRAIVIGSIDADHVAELRFAHIDCLRRNVLGDPPWGPDHPDYDEMGQ